MTVPFQQAGCVWITGASSGIGRAVALRYARAGATVAVSARNAADLNALALEARGLSGRIIPFAVDTTDRISIAGTVTAVEAACGPISLAILNAGTHHEVDASQFDPVAFDRLFAVNVLGTVNCIAAVLPGMLARGTGQLAIVASVAGYRGLKTAAAYGATKAALINMAEALKFDLDPRDIAVRLINPGFVRTPLTDKNPFPMPFLIDADVAAERIWQGLEKSRRFEIAFPRRFVFILKLLRVLPYRLYFWLLHKATNQT